MNIDGMGESLVDQLVDKGLVKSVADVYGLTLEKLADLDRMGKKSAANVFRNIENSKKNPMPRVINALGIPFVGERTAIFLAESFGNLDAIAQADADILQKAEEVGPKVAESIVTFLPNRATTSSWIGCVWRASNSLMSPHAPPEVRSKAGLSS